MKKAAPKKAGGRRDKVDPKAVKQLQKRAGETRKQANKMIKEAESMLKQAEEIESKLKEVQGKASKEESAQEIDCLNLQKMMDKQNKMFSMMQDMMKKSHESQMSIIKNIR